MAVLADTRQPTEGIRLEQPNTTLYMNSTNNIGKGTLYITESYVTWLSGNDKGITLPYPNIILHAISRDLSRFPHECIYIHTDAQLPGLTEQESSDDDSDEMLDKCPPVTELFLVPDDNEALNTMYHLLAVCQALHPDPQDDFSPDEDFFDEEEYELDGTPSQLASMNLASNGTNGDDQDMDPECFEDAEDSPDH